MKIKINHTHPRLVENVLSSLIGQLEDGKWEHVPCMDSYWLACKDIKDNVIVINTEDIVLNYNGRYINNRMYKMTESEIMKKYCSFIHSLIKDNYYDCIDSNIFGKTYKINSEDYPTFRGFFSAKNYTPSPYMMDYYTGEDLRICDIYTVYIEMLKKV